jgi:hypothetical protein
MNKTKFTPGPWIVGNNKVVGYRITEHLTIDHQGIVGGKMGIWKRYTYNYWIQAQLCHLGLRFLAWTDSRERRIDKCIDRLYEPIVLDYSQIDDVEVDGIDARDCPDFCDAYIASATYKGREMTEEELDELNDDRDFVYEAVQEKLY